MTNRTLFEMWGPFRQSIIRSHKFYVEQAHRRLLSQFDNINKDADQAAEDWLEAQSCNFDPERHDPADFYERANDVGIEFYQLLVDMHERTRLSVVAGIYHEWDKQFRKWVYDEISHWYRGEIVLAKIWTVDVGKLFELFSALGWEIRDKSYFQKLNTCRLVVNVFKHGDGTSLAELQQHYPEYLHNPFDSFGGQLSDVTHLDHTNLRVSDEHIDEFSEAMIEFWLDLPERIVNSPSASLPKWFESAILIDQKNENNNK
ncbi:MULTISPECIES: hypothetical protein [Chromatiaceae]|uniref:hypothetical protein n=1 Tax=Chromatiaceae TaxID=1046 RepID=UPI0003816CE0|nr:MULTISPECIES: hypothetical protein [Chromatiaceae]MDP2716911.1 hypothetical protein [Rheinheimera sp.]